MQPETKPGLGKASVWFSSRRQRVGLETLLFLWTRLEGHAVGHVVFGLSLCTLWIPMDIGENLLFLVIYRN